MSDTWTAARIGDLAGRVVIVTGSTSGIGKETARVLAAKHATVVLAVRNTAKGDAVAAEIRAAAPGASVSVARLDLADLASVRSFASAMADSIGRLDVLVNNAGVMFPPYGKTADGFEVQMGTNHLGHFALTGLLLPLLAQTAEPRVVTVSSMLHNRGNVDFDDLAWEKRRFNTQQAYSDSKLANLWFANELARRAGGAADRADGQPTGLSGGQPGAAGPSGRLPLSLAAHPGWTATDLQRHSLIMRWGNKVAAQRVAGGALPTLRAATDPAAAAGQYFGPARVFHTRGHPVVQEPAARAHDLASARRLWDVSVELTGVPY